jgi:hypothetical protein
MRELLEQGGLFRRHRRVGAAGQRQVGWTDFGHDGG